MDRKADRLDFLFASCLALLTILSRLPYRTHILYNWDSVQFALALDEYDIVKHQPHPPGYILYVVLGRLLNVWLRDPTASYVLLAVLFSGMTTFVVYHLAREVWGRATALAAATLLAVSPVFWFYGSVGLTYAGEALFASTVAYFAYRALEGSEPDAFLGAAYLGLAGGMRQSILVLLVPLWVASVAIGVRRVRTLVIGGAILLAAGLSWFLPMIWLTGGLERYLAASFELADSVVKPTSVVSGPLDVTFRMSRYVLESVLVGLGPLALAAVLVPWYVRRHGWAWREWFFVGWMVPPVLVYTLVHFGQAGYVLTFLPALLILLSRVLLAFLTEGTVLATRPRARGAIAIAAVMAVVLVNGSFFVSARPLPRDFETPKPAWVQQAQDEAFDWIWSRTAAALREHEEVVRTFVESIRGLFPPEETVVVTELGNRRSYPWLRHAMFYLPGYTIYELQVGALPAGFYAPHMFAMMTRLPETEIPLAPAVKQIVWFVDHWSPSSERPPGLVEIELPYGRFLYVLPVDQKRIDYADYTFVREEPARRAALAAR